VEIHQIHNITTLRSVFALLSTMTLKMVDNTSFLYYIVNIKLATEDTYED